MRLLHALLGLMVLCATPALGVGVTGTLRADDEGMRLDLQSGLGQQRAHVSWECVPDADGQCSTDADCAPGTLDCHATREPDAPWPCTYQPDGSLSCDPNGTQPGSAPARDEPLLPEASLLHPALPTPERVLRVTIPVCERIVEDVCGLVWDERLPELPL